MLVTRAAVLSVAALFVSSCANIEKPAVQPFVSVTQPPAQQEFRWSNGKAPKSFDPARASAAPETDIVRALFQGLTDIDSKTLQAVPGAAEKWTASDDLRTWTFQLRKDAKWSNGRRVTADDFVDSWRRLTALGDKAAHRDLFQNIVGLTAIPESAPPVGIPTGDSSHPLANVPSRPDVPSASQPSSDEPKHTEQKPDEHKSDKPVEKKFGVEAIDDQTLRVTLQLPDKDFPKLVADTVFRPIYGDGAEFDDDPLDDGVVTNGPFTVAEVGKDGVALKRSETYWNKSAVGLERIRFIPKESGEAALEAYKKGELDAVTNADLEPLALKLLTPYEDFRQTAHGALNMYEVNTKNPPFSDRRVREALAISIDRDRLTDGELEGSTQAATTFFPDGDGTHISLDVARARDLLERAGYSDGNGFPAIRLVINRNDVQQRVAKAVAKMWKQNLNIDTQMIVKETGEMEAVKTSGEYDLIRRGVVLPSLDEMVGLNSIIGNVVKAEPKPTADPIAPPLETPLEQRLKRGGPADSENAAPSTPPVPAVMTEDDALYDFSAIPLYFPTSYSLVKPYIRGFESNSIDAVNIDQVVIDNNWQPDRSKGES
ncbi:MAG: peptide ABC transporter substrate-binding protein [Acidobacteria bacterium]|nr:peptide ABC transporter substrate-binding protein [Acidobacteriota bacterium]